jgi:hypothetical protein
MRLLLLFYGLDLSHKIVQGQKCETNSFSIRVCTYDKFS